MVLYGIELGCNFADFISLGFPSPHWLSFPNTRHYSKTHRRLYCQRFPFFQNAEVVKAARLEEVADAVSNTPIKYDYGPWPTMSSEGTDFIKKCLTRPESDRIGVSEALQHPWFKKYISEEELAAAVPKGTSQQVAGAA